MPRSPFQPAAWAGKPRTVRISKDGSVFCYPEHINATMRRLFERLHAKNYLRGHTARDFAKAAAHLLAELNAIHCFREGNGRTQLTYFALLSTRAGHPPALDRMKPDAMLEAMVSSFMGIEEPLAILISRIIDKR